MEHLLFSTVISRIKCSSRVTMLTGRLKILSLLVFERELTETLVLNYLKIIHNVLPFNTFIGGASCDSRGMASMRCEELESELEPLPISAHPSPTRLTDCTPSSSQQAHCSPYVNHSWPCSPWDESREVTARLFSSLQLSCELQAKVQPCHSPRQVSFQFSSALPSEGGRYETKPSLNLQNPSPGERQDSEGEKEKDVEEMGVNLPTGVDYSNRHTNGKRHIQDMENVRAHLQTMLRSTPTLETEGSSSVSEIPNQHSFNSDGTSQLLGSGVGGLEESFPLCSSHLQFDGLFSPETTVLRESLDREQCEGQVLVLQNKALELQQRLALAISAERKKDIIIQQLDKTLAKVVEGWRKHEQEKSEVVKRQEELAERRHSQQQETINNLEQSMSQASKALEQEKRHSEELQRKNRQLELRLAELEGSVLDGRRECERVCVERNDLCVERDRLRLQAQEAQAALSRFQEQTDNERRSFEDKTFQLTSKLQEESECKNIEKQHLVEVREELEQVRGELEQVSRRILQLEEEREEARRERDTERRDRALEQARFEAQCFQLEVKLKQESETVLSLHQEQTALKEHNRKQLLDLHAHHERQLSAQVQQHQQRIDTLTKDYQTRLAHSQQQYVLLEESKKSLEEQREELVSRLQRLLRSHWTEALTLLSTQTERSSLPSWCDEPTDWRKQHVVQEPSSSTHIIDQCRADVYTHTAVKHGERIASFAEDAQAMLSQLSRQRGRLSGQGEARAVTKERERVLESWKGRKTDSGHLGVVLNHSLSFHHLEPQLDPVNTRVLDDMMGCVGDQKEDVQQIDGNTVMQQRAQCVIADSIPNHGSSGDHDRRTELHYYVSMLLDRSPGQPVESLTKDNTGLQSLDNSQYQCQDPLDPPAPENQTHTTYTAEYYYCYYILVVRQQSS
ncbi:hypothetical protein UPYG_G00040920 [Umbra pygmaea]|uniref:Centrobin n=1 Tax=Umbra pygmaea TaxID=75934 RepID=A0ABD0XRQ2_UMBPY